MNVFEYGSVMVWNSGQINAAGLDGWAFLEFRRLIWRILFVIGAMLSRWTCGSRHHGSVFHRFSGCVLSVVLLPMHYQAGRLIS